MRGRAPKSSAATGDSNVDNGIQHREHQVKERKLAHLLVALVLKAPG
jgi:hypothetical protein